MHDAVDEHWPQWFAVAGREAVAAAVRSLYDRVDAEVAVRSPTCWISGRCCDFDAYGHRLYVTALEIAWFLEEARRAGRTLPGAAEVDLRGGCPFQVARLCSTHAIRPLGCRLFFCQQGTQEWQHETYERFLADLRLLHDRHGIPYRYLEWRAGLREALAASRKS